MALPIGGFMPIPLAMMIPFMATQSLVMGDAFGKAYQFGKRKISAMSNEDFNKLTLTDLISEMQTDFKLAIPKIHESIEDSTELQSHIISEMLKILPKFVTSDANVDLGKDISKTFGTQLTPEGGGFNLGGIKIVIEKLIENFSIPQAFGHTEDSSGITQGPTQGPPSGPSPPPASGILGNLDIHKTQVQEHLKTLDRPTTPHTASAINRNKIASSGQSPLATRAKATFRANITEEQRILDYYLARFKQYSARPPNAGFIAIYKERAEDATLQIAKSTKKLGALRAKYQQTYGEWY